MRSLVAALLLVSLGGGLTACTNGAPKAPASAPSVAPTPLSVFDTRSVTVARADFCGLIPRSAAERALAAPVASESDYANGERSTIVPHVHDVSHEFSCSWSAADGTTARAWVFAPRVPKAQAKSMIRDLRRQKRCSTPDAPAFGKPSVATVCTSHTGIEAAYHGLFVDAWLSCSVSGTRADKSALLDRAGEWCVQVAAAADTGQD